MTENTIYIKRLYQGSRRQGGMKSGDLLEKQSEYLALAGSMNNSCKPASLLDFCHIGQCDIQIFDAFHPKPPANGYLAPRPARIFPAILPETQRCRHRYQSAA